MTATNSPQKQQPEDIDRLLGTFFRGEVPTPWPTFEAPIASPAVGRGGSALSPGRVALAASVAALLVGSWFLSGRLPGVPVDAGSLDSGKASVPRELRPGTTHPTPPARR
jgi:hypothetical protein